MSFVSTSAMLVRRDAFLAGGGFNEELRCAEDLELLLRLFSCATAAVVEAPLSVYRKYGGNLSADAVAAAGWQRRVWETVIAAPERYAAGLDQELRDAFPGRLRADALLALRYGRFADARACFVEARARGDRFSKVGVAVARAANSAFGRGLHGALRAMWRRLPRRA